MAIEEINAEASRFDCLRNYLTTELTLEALRVLRNVLITLKALLETYLQYMVIDKINIELEEFLMNLRVAPYEQFLQTVTNLVNNAASLFPPDALQDCLAAGEVMQSIYESLDRVQPLFGKLNEWNSRYKIAGQVENFYMETITETLSYIDVLIILVDDAIAAQGG